MVDLKKLIQPDLIIRDLGADTKDAAFEILVRHLHKHRPECFGGVSIEETLRMVHEREGMQSTGVGNHVAFPHARVHGWCSFAAVIGLSPKGIDYQSMDGKLVHVICLMISSEDEPYLVLKAMAAFSRLFHSVSHPLELFDGKHENEVSAEWHKSEDKAAKQIIAHDLMRPVKAVAYLDTPVQEVARTMHLNHLDVLPVLEEDDHFYGVISCSDIFSYGIPDFFNQLHTVAFVRHIDPFEKYYKIRKNLKVGDLVKRDMSTAISKDNTLLEVVFQLTVKQRSRLFILDDGMLAGEIDRFSIVDKILFY